MSLARRTLPLLMVVLLSTLGLAVVPARAASAEAIKAADYIVSTFKPGKADQFGDVGSAADSLIALVSTGDAKYDDDIAGIVAFLQKNAKTYVSAKNAGTAGAAKLAVAAAAVHADATSFGGVDLIAEITGGIGADGAFGAFPGPFSSGMAMVALARNDARIPDSMVDYLLTYQEPRSGTDGGGFGCTVHPYDPAGDCPKADPDSTAMAVLGLQAAGTDKATTAANAALEWLKGMQMADGSWQNYSPVNSTGLVGPLFPPDSDQATRATAYVVSKQLKSGALTTGTTDKANLIATQQGIFALTGVTYATVGGSAGQPSASPTPSSSESPTASASASPTPSATASPTPAPPAPTSPLPAALGIGFVMLTVVALAGLGIANAREQS